MSSVAPASESREPTHSETREVPVDTHPLEPRPRERMLRASNLVFSIVGLVTGGQLALLALSAVSLFCDAHVQAPPSSSRVRALPH